MKINKQVQAAATEAAKWLSSRRGILMNCSKLQCCIFAPQTKNKPVPAPPLLLQMAHNTPSLPHE
jgi:hypothetical protein